MRNLSILVLVVFVVGLALVIGSRLPVGAITVIAGVGCGVLASIPTSFLIVAVTGRRSNQHTGLPGQQTYPPVVVVNSPPGSAHGGQSWPATTSPWEGVPPTMPRQFHVIGQENGSVDRNEYTGF